MAELTRVNGTAFGVVSVDRGAAGSGAIAADELVQFHGRSLSFFKILAKDTGATAVDLSAALDAGEAVEAILRTVQGADVSTTHYAAGIVAYQVEGDTTGQISICLEGGNWTAGAMQTALQALGTVATLDLSGTLVTSGGFKLA